MENEFKMFSREWVIEMTREIQDSKENWDYIDGVKYVPEQQSSAGEYLLTIDNDMDVFVDGEVEEYTSYLLNVTPPKV